MKGETITSPLVNRLFSLSSGEEKEINPKNPVNPVEKN